MSELDTVVAWHAALNAGDVDGLLALSTDDVEVGGPRGTGRGAHLLRDWATRAGVRMQPGRHFQRVRVVVTEESAQWTSEDGQLGEPQTVACVYAVRDGKVDSIMRYPDLASALAATGFDEAT